MLASIGYAVAYTGVGIALLVLGFFVLDLLTPGHLGRHIYENRSVNAARACNPMNDRCPPWKKYWVFGMPW